jgi:hypothetical protein
MKLLTLLFLFLSISVFAQKNCESDTTINKFELLKLKSLNQDCSEEISRYTNTIEKLEKSLSVYQKRIKFLEDLVIHREKYKIKKCPTFKKNKKRKRFI